jgi:hypothetical protein
MNGDFRALALLNLLLFAACLGFVFDSRRIFAAGTAGAVVAWLIAPQALSTGPADASLAHDAFWRVLEVGGVLVLLFAVTAGVIRRRQTGSRMADPIDVNRGDSIDVSLWKPEPGTARFTL